ncbi:hypothetical protein CANMA_002570 [Candida margitis]|uniref:uncharacterized protein n=1 Tax=Candida margitis TaxID=1775924 RepID=UPI0022262160|nr:uncharacterized protein CANMA_002570 [Candida margitis]KAI5968147.1 hypothetical protein CANMA_002570 [Candida margitis]
MNKEVTEEEEEEEEVTKDVAAIPDTFKILDSSNNIEIVISPIHMINLKSIIDVIPTQTSLQSHQSLLSELSNDKNNTTMVESVLHIFKSDKFKLRCDGYWLCKLKFKIDDKFNHWGVVFPIVGIAEKENGDGCKSCGYFGVFKINELISEDKSADYMYPISNEADLINASKETAESTNYMPREMFEDTMESFSMKPPASMVHKTAKANAGHDNEWSNVISSSPSKREESHDPVQFLTNRYYHSLYSLNEPLSYFPKTALTRFKNLCLANEASILAVLDTFILSMDKFDQRYDGKSSGGFFINDENLSECEVRHQGTFKERLGFSVERKTTEDGNAGRKKKENIEYENGETGNVIVLDGIDNDKLQKLILELKIREAQLQIILLFEVFQSMSINEDEFLAHNLQKSNELLKQTQDQQKVSLVRARKKRKINKSEAGDDIKSKKRVKPTTLVATASSTHDESKKNREFSYYSYLNKLIDRLNLWEVLVSEDKHDKRDKRDKHAGNNASSSYGFMAYVLVPYYSKTLPVLMKYVIQNMKNTNMKLTTNHKKKKSKKKTSPSSSGTVADNDDDPKQQSKSGKSGGSEKTKPKLERKPLLSNDHHLIKDISIASLKRSKSSIGQSSRDLDKRQVDLNFKQPLLKKQNSQFGDDSTKANATFSASTAASSSSLFIFGQAKRSKSIANGEKPGSNSVVNVAETPMKPVRGDTSTHGPGAVGAVGGNLMKSFSQIEATPAKQRVVDLEVFTPVSNAVSKSNESSTHQNQVTSSIFTSPANGDGTEDGSVPFLKPGASSMTQRLQSAAAAATSVATSVTTSPHQGSDVVVIEATPKRQRTNESATYTSPNDMVVEATPIRNGVIERGTPKREKYLNPSIIQATPVQNASKLNSLHNTPAVSIVEATPKQQQQQTKHSQSPFLRRAEGTNEFKSPIARTSTLSSSPSVHKTKPGDPIAISESPIYSAYAATGLLSLDSGAQEKGEEDDIGYDSDEILNPKKKKARATYSRR